MALNESGELASRLKGLEEGALEDCRTCGGAGFVLCTWCQGMIVAFVAVSHICGAFTNVRPTRGSPHRE